jgi:hypothetical protein
MKALSKKQVCNKTAIFLFTVNLRELMLANIGLEQRRANYFYPKALWNRSEVNRCISA